MNLRGIPRAAVGGYVKAPRWPVDRVIGRTTAVDRAEAEARDAAGSVLGDEELKRDADRRRTAATERKRAQRLREAAEAHAKQEEARQERERKERLAQLETKAEALGEREEALVAKDEAKRLKQTAAKTKAARKS